MTEDFRPTDTGGAFAPGSYSFDEAGNQPSVSPLAMAKRILRGRYRLAIGLGALLAAGGAAAGWYLPRPVYRSRGLIDIAPKLPKILKQIDETGLLPMFDSYVAAQVQTAASRRVIDLAMGSEAWKKLGRGLSDKAIGEFQQSLTVQCPARGEVIEVAFVDESPEAATTAVNSVIDAYMSIVDERESASGNKTQDTLRSQQALITSKLNELRGRVMTATVNLGVEHVDARYRAVIDECNKLDAAIHDLDIAPGDVGGAAGTVSAPNRLTDQDLALKDKLLESLLADQAKTKNQLDTLEQVSGFGPNHPEVKLAKTNLASLATQIAERVQVVRASLSEVVPGVVGLTSTEREARRQTLTKTREQLQTEVKNLSQQRFELQGLEAERVEQAQRLDEVKRRIDEINVESGVHGRTSVISRGERPVAPATDKRFQMTMFGAFGGVALGFGFVILIGSLRARLRHVADVDSEKSWGRLLGALPEVVDGGATDVASADMSDGCVQHIRTMLQLNHVGETRVVALTSPSPGAGKTTVSLALGTSFAAAGSRTLLIDCDFAGHGLTSAMRSIVSERVQKQDGDADAGAKATRSARSPGKSGKIAGMLAARRATVDDGRLDEIIAAARTRTVDADPSVARAVTSLAALARRRSGDVAATGRPRRGILRALDGAPLDECVVDTGTSGLALLPVGDAIAIDVESLSPAAFRRLIAACRENYDTIIIDTGPVLGSIEAAFATAVADDVVLVLSRGERRLFVDAALQRLRSIGAQVVGVVFNRALVDDVARSSYSSGSSVKDAEAA